MTGVFAHGVGLAHAHDAIPLPPLALVAMALVLGTIAGWWGRAGAIVAMVGAVVAVVLVRAEPLAEAVVACLLLATAFAVGFLGVRIARS